MKTITFPLKLQMKRPQVGDLQDALQLLMERGVLLSNDDATRRELSEALKNERTEQRFGKATRQLVALFQEEQRLPPSGQVDERTANALNALLERLGAFDREPASRFHIVSGAVRREDGLPLRSMHVRAAHEVEQRSVRLGEDVTDGEGRYTIRYAMLPGIESINLRVSAIGKDGKLLQASDLVKAARPLETVDLVTPMAEKPAAERRIEGTIVLEHGLPAGSLKLRLYRRGFGGEVTRLGETSTLEGGQYAFSYDPGGQALSLEVRAVNDAGEEIPLSKPLNDLSREPRAVLNLAAPGSLKPLTAEYRRLSEDLTPHLGQMSKLAEAEENGKRQDLTVLNRATGWDARLIALAATTERLRADPEVDLPREAVYGLLRAGLPSDKLLLAQVGPDVAEQALTVVRDAGIVELSDAEIGAFKTAFTTFRNAVRLNIPAPGSRSTYGALLETSGLSQEARDAFLPLYLDHRGTADELWKNAREAGLDEAQIRTLKLQGKLAFLAGNSEAMTGLLLGKKIDDPAQLGKKIDDPAQLVEQDLHRSDEWVKEVLRMERIPFKRLGKLTREDEEKLDRLLPPAYAAKDVEDRLTAYAEDMARKVRLSYPTQVIGRLMETDATFRPLAVDAGTATLLRKAAAKGFRLGETPVATFLRDNAEVTAGIDEPEREAARQQLQTLQRVYQITPTNEAMPVLMSLGMTSAHDVTAYPEAQFTALFEAKYRELHNQSPASTLAKMVRRRSQQVSSVTYNLFTMASQLNSAPPVAGISPSAAVRDDARNELIKHFPTMESLFGSLDFCECEHCRSVLSPAAYLVDLLQFVDSESGIADGNGMTPYDVLVERRPDLPHIPLTCENTHTALPYIDVVNEILEYYVAHGRLEEEAGRDTGEATTEELLAEPQNVIREAYDTLSSARYPLNLPFDLWLETVRKFCDYFETPLHRVLEALRPDEDLFAPIQNPTNLGNATVSLGNGDAAKLSNGMVCTYFLASTNALSGESKRISTIGAADTGGAGQTTITFVGTWTSAPVAGDRLVSRPLDQRAAIFMESLGLAPAEVGIFADADLLANDKWHGLYGFPSLRAPIQSPTNVGNATLSVANADARKLEAGLAYTYFDASANAFSAESKILASIGASDLDGAAQTTLTLEGSWITPPVTGDLLVCDVPAMLKSAKALSRRLGVSYKEIAEIVKSEFVNPELAELSLLYKLDVSVRDAKLYKDEKAFYEANKDLLGVDRSTLSAADQQRFDDLGKKRPNREFTGWQVLTEVTAFEHRLADLATAFEPPLNVVDLRNGIQAIPFDRVLVLADPDTGCNFDETTLQCADGTKADAVVFLRINLLVRLWRKLGWSIEETDRALTTFVPQSTPFDGTPGNLAKQPLKTALIYLAHLEVLDAKLKVGKQSRLKLLTLWSNIATTGKKPLYAHLFLNRSVLESSPVFDHPLGQYLTDTTIKLKDHLLALQGALGLTADEIGRILADAGRSLDTAELSLANASLLYRYGLLAKAVKLPVRDLIALKQLSGLHPFRQLLQDPLVTLDQDHPYSQTLEFVKVAEEVKDSGLKIEDLEYLLQHRFDEAGKYQPDREATLALLRSLSEGVRAIRAEHAVPADQGALSDDVLRPKLGLALAPDVVERFLGMINTTVEFTAATSGVDAAHTLDPEAFATEERIRQVSYKEVPHKEQKLTVRGVLFDPAKTAIKDNFDTVLNAPQRQVFAKLLDGVATLARDFFDNQLKKQTLRLDGEAGFLKDTDFSELFAPLEPLTKIAPTDSQAEVDFKRAENQKTERRNLEELQKRRHRIGVAFLPFLQQRLLRQFIVQTMTSHTGADPVLVESLVGDERLLAVPSALLNAFSATADRGLNATFWTSADGSGAPLTPVALIEEADTRAREGAGDPLEPGADSARLEGYVEVPTTGAYRFHVELDKQNAQAELRFRHRPEPVLVKGTAGTDNFTLGDQPDEYLELKAGVLYHFSLDLKHLNGGNAELLVQGETVPKGRLSQLTLYPAAAIEAAERATTLLNKALHLVQSLGLSERELRYVLTHAADFDGMSLSDLPTSAVGDSPTERTSSAQRFGRFRRLAAYARLKRDLAIEASDLIDVFEANGTTAADRLEKQVYPLIAKLTRRDEATVRATAEALVKAPAVAAFESERPLWRLWEASQVVERFGVPVASLLEWTHIVSPAMTPAERFEHFEIARDLKEAVKARFEPESWQRVAQPIFDKLRQRQRDALGTHVMHQHGFDRLEQLYEYFLIDPGMEPVVQTSRIRLAIASLQLFIQRSLLNLEKKVRPSDINSGHWEWMKRYRVWEANRRIFLFPENWLEPEFRDDKTHLFSELEGALLQGDVSTDLVEDAFLNYLRKLDELARLDIVAMHIEDEPAAARRTLHVFGRTYSQPHKYFYRRYADQAWTPWEPVSAEIEGDHLAPVVWRDRLYLFWVTFMDKPNPDAKPAKIPKDNGSRDEATVSELKMSEIESSMRAIVANKRVDIQLHWSEYLQGEWSTRESGGASGSTAISTPVSNTVTSGSFSIHVSKEYDAGEERGVFVHLNRSFYLVYNPLAFYLASRNSSPIVVHSEVPPTNPYISVDRTATNRYAGSGTFKVRFRETITTEPGTTHVPITPDILGQGDAYTLLPCNNNLTALGVSAEALQGAVNRNAVEDAIESGLEEIASLMKPVFYQDHRHTLFVEPSVTENTIEELPGWIAPRFDAKPGLFKANTVVVAPGKPGKGLPPDSREPPLGIEIDPASLIAPTEAVDWLLNPLTVLQFDGVLLGPTGTPASTRHRKSPNAASGTSHGIDLGTDIS